jgi:ribonuclease R
VAPGLPARGHGKGGGSRARVLRRLGRPDVARDVIEALMLDRGLARGFDPAVGRAGRLAAEAPIDDGLARRDLRQLATFTIDPDTARDFDDAISCREEEGGWRVWVHIADVSSYVTPRSPVDREAYRRGTSVYVPGAVEPMLAVELSNGVCSLVPEEDRRALSVEMFVREGEVRRASFHSALIRSDRRLTYGFVDEIFNGRERAEDPWGAGLTAARACAASIQAAKASDTALVIQSAEPSFRFDRAGHVESIEREVQTESHRLIETLMIAANEQVAKRLEQAKVPALYRVHERPRPEAVERMIDQLASLGVPTPPVPGGALTPQQAGDVAGEASVLVADWVRRHDGQGALALGRIVLRSLKQAVYLDTNKGHSGLALHSYCHFTSPIRRYPDLICHRALMSLTSGSVPAPEASFVAAAGPVCSASERAAMIIERDADDVARCFLLERSIFEAEGRPPASYDGQIVGLIGAGAFISFGPELEYEGMLPVRSLRGDWYELNEQGTALIGERGGALRLGDQITVAVNSIDAPRGRVDLVLPCEASDG